MTFFDSGPRFRSRTHEMTPFWSSMGHGHYRYDDEVRAVEWAFLAQIHVGALLRAGFTCSRQVEAAPDWLLLTISGLGKIGVRNVRAVIPYRRDIYRPEPCPGRLVEKARGSTRHFERQTIEELARQASTQLMVERVLYGAEHPPEV